ncbi:FGGY-family carbohydrate kinase [Lentilitoribacter sp. Alg239-R112]|uniref:FGGY-family carbohydrate kinase n=1 Tax=Lentilitoribacter sp. Alg239-R112 TaxID=2305987 RepID=UPI0013A6C08A|nr:FGGY-family carbohydrate kinase [Lentilitoribacter sp. Alg239-R112]
MVDIYLGLDLGTSGCKLIAFDRTGDVIASTSRSYAVSNPGPGLMELNADIVWRQAVDCFKELRSCDLSGVVRTLAISCFGEAVVPIGKGSKVLAPSQLSADMRCGSEVAELEHELGGDEIYRMTGQPLAPIYTLPKLMWMRKYEPEVFEQTWKFLCFGDFALLRLGLSPIIDESMAARTLCYDVKNHSWSQRLLDLAGVRLDQLSPIGRSGDMVGVIPEHIATDLMLPTNISVVLGGHDQPMGALGAGVVEPGTAMYSIGTTEALVVVVDKPDHAALSRGHVPCAAHADAGKYAALAGNQSGGRLLAWYRDCAGLPSADGSEPLSIGEMIASLPDEPPEWPLVLPHFLGSGSFLNDHHSVGAFYGLRADTSRSDMMLALLEGITFEQAISLEALEQAGPVSKLHAIGGGTRSQLWLQMKADILNKPIVRIGVEDAPCLASAILGRSHYEKVSVEALVGEMLTEQAVYTPRPERHRLHAKRLVTYRKLYEALRNMRQHENE